MQKLEFDENGDSQLLSAIDEASGHKYNFCVRRVRRATMVRGMTIQEVESAPFVYFLVDESGQPLSGAVPLDAVLLMTRARLSRKPIDFERQRAEDMAMEDSAGVNGDDYPRPLGAC